MFGRSDLPLDAVSLLRGLKSYDVAASKHTFITPDSLHESRRNYINVALRCGLLLDISDVIGEKAYTVNDTGRPDTEVMQEASDQDWKRVRRVGIRDVPLPRRGGCIDPISAFDDRNEKTEARRTRREEQNEFPYKHGRNI
jgi:hypothetical protein